MDGQQALLRAACEVRGVVQIHQADELLRIGRILRQDVDSELLVVAEVGVWVLRLPDRGVAPVDERLVEDAVLVAVEHSAAEPLLHFSTVGLQDGVEAARLTYHRLSGCRHGD